MDTSTIEVIIPVYKVEPYLRKCIDSLLNQNYDNFHISLVDDGSPDSCGLICDEYAEKHTQKITVYHKPNGGLSDARNFAVEHTNADFVIFVDSDDYVGPDFVKNLVAGLVEHDIDMVISPLYRVLCNEKGCRIIPPPHLKDSMIMSNLDTLKELCYEKYYGNFACAKLIRRSIVKDHPYPFGKLFEDAYTTYKHAYYARKIYYTNKPDYYYLQRVGSIVRSKFTRKHLGRVLAAAEMVIFMKNNNLSEDIIESGVYKLFYNAHATLRQARTDKDYDKYYNEIREMLRNNYKQLPIQSLGMKQQLIFRMMRFTPILYRLYLLMKY